MPLFGYEPLPDDPVERAELLFRDSTEYIRRMGRSDVYRLLQSLSATYGLTLDDMLEEQDERFRRWREEGEPYRRFS